jgi:hypothetical protein
MPNATHQIVDEGFGYLNRKTLDSFFALYSDDMRNPSLATMGVSMFYAAFSDTQFLPHKVVCEGDTAMFR